ncbi:MAG: [protein-PII] uridylyltransferase [Acidimicrobiales bacterium]
MAEASLRERRARLLENSGLRGLAFCRAYAAEADAWLSGVADQAARHSPVGFVLLAVGGYGRTELFPYSDLDLVLLHGGKAQVDRVAEGIWYPIWNEGIRLDHSVRTPSEVLRLARSDLRVALGLLDSRIIWGDSDLARPVLSAAAHTWSASLFQQWLPALQRQAENRRNRNGDLAYLLEPDLKESHGGLRDANVLRALASVAPSLSSSIDLEALGPAESILADARVALHRKVRKPLDKLVLQEQDSVAEALDCSDADDLMKSISYAARTIGWLTDEVWQRQHSWQPQRRRTFGPSRHVSRIYEVEPGISVHDSEVHIASHPQDSEVFSLVLRLASVAAERAMPVGRTSIVRLAEVITPLTGPWDTATRDALVRLLRTGRPAIAAIETLDREGLFSRIIPEWADVRCLPQRNAYHRFTVDRHLLECAAFAATLAETVERPDLLMVGALLHDLGKGYHGDHSEVGAQLSEQLTARMGFPANDVQTVVTMVRHHLLLPNTATRRDLDDPVTVQRVAETIGDLQTLSLLAALAEADGLATGPAAWTPWRAGLVRDLVDRTASALRGEPLVADPKKTRVLEEMVGRVRSTGRCVVRLDAPEVLMAAPDQRGLLASLAAVLALHGLDVRSADASSLVGVAVDVFGVEAVRGVWPTETQLAEDLERVLAGALDLEPRLAERELAYRGSQRPSAARPVEPQVTVDHQASMTSTVLELRAGDEIGLLHRVTRVIFEHGLDVVAARATTTGHEVVDAFYVRTADGAKATDPGLLQALTEALRTAAS